MLRPISCFLPACVLEIFLAAAMASIADAAAPVLGMDCVTLNSAKTQKPPCLVNGRELKFVVLGDWGGQSRGKDDQNVNRDVSKMIIDLAKRHSLHFVLNVGDNFYPFFSDTKTAEEQFDSGFHTIFPEKEINLPFYSMLGNHDYINRYGIKEQVDYTNNKKATGRWILPERYYTMNFQLSENGKLVKFVMIDTQLLCGAFIRGTKSEWRPTGREQMTPRELQESIAHEKWLLAEIWNAHKVHYLFVVGHYHTHTVRTDVPDVECMRWVLSDNLLARHRVTAYISGHEHLLQHWEFATDHGTIHHVLSGEGYTIQPISVYDIDAYKNKQSAKFFHGRVENARTSPRKFQNANENKPGVILVAVGDGRATFGYTDNTDASTLLHSFSVSKRATSEKPQGMEPVVGQPFASFGKQITGRTCKAEWAMMTNGKKSVLLSHAIAGNIGCVSQSTPPSVSHSVAYRAGGNRLVLKEAEKNPKKPALPIWTCWRCTGSGSSQKLVQAFCHVGDDLDSKDGFLAYDRFVDHESFRYMCNGIRVKCDNKKACGVLLTTPEFRKQTGEKIAVEKSVLEVEGKTADIYGLSAEEDISFAV